MNARPSKRDVHAFSSRRYYTPRSNPRHRLEEAATLKLGAESAISGPNQVLVALRFSSDLREGFTAILAQESGFQGSGYERVVVQNACEKQASVPE